jgi:hypothetical protein
MHFDIACCHVPQGFWERQRKSFREGTFWAEEARTARAQPKQRLRIALENLPLPAAFREAGLALRQMIREKRKVNACDNEELNFLYSLAAVESFVSATAYIEDLAEPGWNAIDLMTPQDWQSLTYGWTILGCNELPLLTKTDRRHMIERWGEPNEHTTLRRLHEDVWTKAVDALLARRVHEHNTGWLAPRQPITPREYLEFVKRVQESVKANDRRE